jgi:hypothetical protein
MKIGKVVVNQPNQVKVRVDDNNISVVQEESDIGEISVGKSNHVNVKIDEQKGITVQSPTHSGKGYRVGDLLDVDDSVLADGYTLRYSSITHQYHTAPISEANVLIIDGGHY